MCCKIYNITCVRALQKIGQVGFLTVNDCDISKCLAKQGTFPVFEREDGTPGGPELARGPRDGEKANLLK